MQYFDHMALFVAVIKSGSFSKAAEQLTIAQSSLSRKISELEQYLGGKLLHRTTRKLQLTELGQWYFDKALAIVAEFENTQQEVLQRQREPSGLLKLSVVSEFALEWLNALLPDFYTRYPKIALQIDVSPHKVDLLGGQVDMAVRAGQPSEPMYIAHKLMEVKFFVYSSESYIRKAGKVLHPDALKTHFCLAFNGQNAWQLSRDGEMQSFDIHAPYQSNSFEFLKKLTKQGLGIALLPSMGLSTAAADKGLLRILPDWQGLTVPIVALTATRLLPHKVRCMLEFLQEKVSQQHDVSGQKKG